MFRSPYFSGWLDSLRPARPLSRRRNRSPRRAVAAAVELLEDRTLLTAYVVDSLADDAVSTGAVADNNLTLREAITAANTNAAFGDAPAGSAAQIDTITFDPALTGQTLTLLQGQFTIADELRIDATGITIDAGGLSRVFNVDVVPGMGAADGVTDFALTGGTLTNGTAADGGAVLITVGEDVRLDGVTVSNSTAVRGGGVYNAGDLRVSDATIRGNVAIGAAGNQGGGGVFNAGGALVVTGGSIDGNSANGALGSGGGLFTIDGRVTVTDTQIVGNDARRAGGGIEAVDGRVFLTDSDLSGNTASRVIDAMTGATAGNGGGLHVTDEAAVTVTRGTVNDNRAGGEGGGLWNSANANMTVLGATIIGNVARGDAADDGGGGLFNNGGGLFVADSILLSNSATGTLGSGGGIQSLAGRVTVTNTQIVGNDARRAGGGIEAVDGQVFLTDVGLIANVANRVVAGGATAGNGGGLHVTAGAAVTVTRGIVGGNRAGGEGGGLWNAAGSTMTVRGTTISQNVGAGAAADDGGGAIFNNGGTLVVADAALLGNSANGALGSGGGILSLDGRVTVTNTQIVGNDARRAGGGIEAVNGQVLLTDVALDANTANRVVAGGATAGNGGGLHVTGNAGVTVTRGTVNDNRAGGEGGGLWNAANSTMTVRDVTIDGNVVRGAAADDGGGGLFNNGGTLVVIGGAITGNVANVGAGSGGGILSLDGRVTVTNTRITGNSARRAGGGIEAVDGQVLLTDVDLSGNSANRAVAGGTTAGNGGGLHVTGNAGVTVTRGTVNDNRAGGEGGGLWNAANSTMTVRDATITGNVARGPAADDGGGGLFNNGGTLIVSGGTVAGNSANGALGSGGGIQSLGGTVTVTNTQIVGNFALRAGGGIEAVDGKVLLTDVALDANTANRVVAGGATAGNGGGLHVTGNAGVTVTRGTVNDNRAGGEGGGLWNAAGATMIVVDATVSRNVARGAAADDGGGGLFNNGGILVVQGTTLNANRATGAAGAGGGIFNFGPQGALRVSNSTVSGNAAAGDGGGIQTDGSSVVLRNVTVTGNRADADNAGGGAGGGVSTGSGTTTLFNTIVAGNLVGAGSAASDLGGNVQTASRNNLIGDAGSAGGLTNGAGGNLVGVNGTGVRPIASILDPVLRDNGGPTLTHSLVTKSAAVDAGSNIRAIDANGNPLAFDQRGTGFPRIVDGTVDIGAFEFVSPVFVNVADDAVLEGNDGRTPFLEFDLTLTRALSGAVTVGYATANGNAVAGFDYADTTGTVTFAAGETRKTVRIAVTGDNVVEGDERAYLLLQSVSPVPGRTVSIGRGQAMGTIVNDDAALVSVSDAVETEGPDGSTRFLVFRVNLSKAVDAPVTVSYATFDGSARAGSDYTATSGSVTFNPLGSTTRLIYVSVVGDDVVERDETLSLRLSNLVNPAGRAVAIGGSGIGTILNDDAAASDALFADGMADALV